MEDEEVSHRVSVPSTHCILMLSMRGSYALIMGILHMIQCDKQQGDTNSIRITAKKRWWPNEDTREKEKWGKYAPERKARYKILP